MWLSVCVCVCEKKEVTCLESEMIIKETSKTKKKGGGV